MTTRPIRRALIAVYDKTGIVEFARALVDEFAVEIISTGGTARKLRDAGVPVTPVEQVTGFPEMLDGRVKTLHPRIHAAILADRDNPEHMRQLAEQQIEPIDLVVVNLYPFAQTVADPQCTIEKAIEMIDIGGPCLLRAAAKNFAHVWPVCEPRLCDELLGLLRAREPELRLTEVESRAVRRTFAEITFRHASGYDRSVSQYLQLHLARETGALFGQACDGEFPTADGLGLFLAQTCRYGENPHQQGALYRSSAVRTGPSLVSSDAPRPPLVPKHAPAPAHPPAVDAEMSYNNYLDADAALGLCAELSRAATGRAKTLSAPSPPSTGPLVHAAVFVKHTNPCGVGVAGNPLTAYERAYLCDPNAAMGGILAVNFAVTRDFAEQVMTTYDRIGKSAGAGGFFVEVWLAPHFDADAEQLIRTAKKWGQNVRLLGLGDLDRPVDPRERRYRSIAGGMLAQSADTIGLDESGWKVVSRRPPDERELADLRLAWLVAKHTKSNAISICRDGQLIGNGAGQMSRVMSCRVATWLARDNGHGERLRGAAAASDAFFPFRDGPDLLAEAGVTALIQPGGSKRDDEVIAACDARGLAMIFTGTRHFRH
ncbi:MAG: bifunctional phosphoribosylaminoimidazolecarboxamide formyltransferase/inosine monophosphate cyclohydrolase [Phycisphaerae bacterium]